MKRWKPTTKIFTPKTKDGHAPSLTATYDYGSIANMFSVAHFPRGGVIEFGEYEETKEDVNINCRGLRRFDSDREK